MRRFDKKKNMQRANQLAEQRHIESNSLIKENAGTHTELKSIAKQLYLGLQKEGLTTSLHSGFNKLAGDDQAQVEVRMQNEDRQEDAIINISFRIDDENARNKLAEKISKFPPVAQNFVVRAAGGEMQLSPKKTKSDYMTEDQASTNQINDIIKELQTHYGGKQLEIEGLPNAYIKRVKKGQGGPTVISVEITDGQPIGNDNWLEVWFDGETGESGVNTNIGAGNTRPIDNYPFPERTMGVLNGIGQTIQIRLGK
jgi:hypothetical protein